MKINLGCIFLFLLVSNLAFGFGQIDGYKECVGSANFAFGISKELTKEQAQKNCDPSCQSASLVHEENGKNYGCTNQFEISVCVVGDFQEGSEQYKKYWLGSCAGTYTDKRRQ